MKKKLTVLLLGLVILFSSVPAFALESTGNATFDNFINDGRFTHGVSWGPGKRPVLSGYSSASCCAYCADFVKYCFGQNSPRAGQEFHNAAEIRAGDVITVGSSIQNPSHWFVVLKRSGNSLYIAEGNCDARVNIGWKYSVGGFSFAGGYHFQGSTPDPGPQPAPTPQGSPIGGGEQVLSDGDYHIASAMNEKMCVASYDGTASRAGSNIHLWDTVNNPDHVFTVKWLGDGFYSIIHKPSGYSLDVTSASLDYGTNVGLWDHNNSGAQKWVIRQSDDPRYFEIVAQCNGLLLDAYDNKSTNGTNICVWGKTGVANQKWRFIAWGKDTGQTIQDGKYEIVSSVGDKALEVSGGDQADGSNVRIWSRTNGENQRWNVKYTGDGYYTLSDCNSGKLLDLYNGNHTPGTNVIIWKPTGVDNQKWIIKPSGGGTYSLINKATGLVADVQSGSNTDGANISGWIGNTTNAQKWTFVKADQHPSQPDKPAETGKCSVSVSANPSGGGNVTGGGNFDKGASVSVSASPNSGYKFAGWFNGSQKVSDDAQYSFYVSENTSLTAKFEKTSSDNSDPTPAPSPSGTTTIYRLYNNVSGEHLYTISQDEVQALTGSSDWNYEGVGWNAPNSGTAVYRLYNPALADHLYTTDENEVKELTANNGWQLDFGGEPIFYSGGSKPIYRLYNADSGRHHLTTDEFEYSLLPQNGWTQEGPKLNCVS